MHPATLDAKVLLRLSAAMTDYRLTRLAQSLPATVPFVGPETQERARGAPFAARLGANESVFGPSPRVQAAIAEAASKAWMYGDPENHDLRAALAAFHEVQPDNIVVGEGIDGLLGYLVRLFIEPGDAVVTSNGAYPTFNYHVAGFGGVLHTVPYHNDHEDPGALFAKAADVDAKLVYLANPDNPMGSWHSGTALAEAMATLPSGCLLVLDEAYLECAPEGTAPDLPIEDPRLIRFRTFSKAHGMAGMRVGYGLAARDLVSAFNKIRNHFGMSRVSQAAALAALGDGAWLAHVQHQVAVARDRISDIARDHGLHPLPSATNFVTIDCGEDGDFAKAVLGSLVAQGIFVRMPFAAPQNRCIRVCAGHPEDLDAFAAALPVALTSARSQFN